MEDGRLAELRSIRMLLTTTAFECIVFAMMMSILENWPSPEGVGNSKYLLSSKIFTFLHLKLVQSQRRAGRYLQVLFPLLLSHDPRDIHAYDWTQSRSNPALSRIS